MSTDHYRHYPNGPGSSPFAVPVGNLDRSRERSRPVHGLVVHQTGRTIVRKAHQRGIDPQEHINNYYSQKRYSVHYSIAWDGTLYQYTDERGAPPHVGVTSQERASYRSGQWARGQGVSISLGGRTQRVELPRTTIARWRAAWPGYKSPQHLFPGASANSEYVGVELPPAGYRNKEGEWVWLATPMTSGMWFTRQQHITVARLAYDLAQRWRWPPNWWADPYGSRRSTRLLGHEDVDLFGRSVRGQGWDPGGLRSTPWISWPNIYDYVRELSGLPEPPNT